MKKISGKIIFKGKWATPVQVQPVDENGYPCRPPITLNPAAGGAELRLEADVIHYILIR